MATVDQESYREQSNTKVKTEPIFDRKPKGYFDCYLAFLEQRFPGITEDLDERGFKRIDVGRATKEGFQDDRISTSLKRDIKDEEVDEALLKAPKKARRSSIMPAKRRLPKKEATDAGIAALNNNVKKPVQPSPKPAAAAKPPRSSTPTKPPGSSKLPPAKRAASKPANSSSRPPLNLTKSPEKNPNVRNPNKIKSDTKPEVKNSAPNATKTRKPETANQPKSRKSDQNLTNAKQNLNREAGKSKAPISANTKDYNGNPPPKKARKSSSNSSGGTGTGERVLYTCSFCPEAFESLEIFTRHLKALHNIEVDPPKPSNVKKESSSNSKNPPNLKKRERLSGNGTIYACNLCNYKSRTEQLKNRHLQKVHGVDI